MQIECVCLVTQGIKKLKLSPTTISATADKFIKNTRSSVENVEITVINTGVKIYESNKFYYVQTIKVLNAKMVVVLPAVRNFGPFFKF